MSADLHEGPEGWVADAIAEQEAHIVRQREASGAGIKYVMVDVTFCTPNPERLRQIGVAVLGETPECNGRCHVGDYPDFDRDCPAHGGPEQEVCPEGCGLVDIADSSTETSGYEEQERSYHVTWLSCGHETAVAVKR